MPKTAPAPSSTASLSSAAVSGEENIKVVLRVRPTISAGTNDNDPTKCLHVVGENSVQLDSHKSSFAFDHVIAQEATQSEVFTTVGKSVIDNCLDGYNGTIFAYGQTGSGKTYTMIGGRDENDCLVDEERGVVPRGMEYLFSLIERETAKRPTMKFTCVCAFLEIYNERVFDLLDTYSDKGKNLRESISKGAYVEDLTEQVVTNPAEALAVLEAGNKNRRVAETSMNRESSRSHAIFTMSIRGVEDTRAGVASVKESRLHLIDLAGSERQKDTQVKGERLREAGSINKSLSTLGTVINALVAVSNGKSRHVPYRNSKLTFFLRDSLGGNTKTFLVATVNPSRKAYGETLSTLNFAQRAKMIKNHAAKNEDCVGNVRELQAEIRRLRALLEQTRIGVPRTVDESTCSPRSATDNDGQGSLNTSTLSTYGITLDPEQDIKEAFKTVVTTYRQAEDEKKDLATRLGETQALVEKVQRHARSVQLICKLREDENKHLKKKLKQHNPAMGKIGLDSGSAPSTPSQRGPSTGIPRLSSSPSSAIPLSLNKGSASMIADHRSSPVDLGSATPSVTVPQAAIGEETFTPIDRETFDRISSLQEEIEALRQAQADNPLAASLLTANKRLEAELQRIKGQYGDFDANKAQMAKLRTRTLQLSEIIVHLLEKSADTNSTNVVIAEDGSFSVSPRKRANGVDSSPLNSPQKRSAMFAKLREEVDLKHKVAELTREISLLNAKNEKAEKALLEKVTALSATEEASKRTIKELEHALSTERAKYSIKAAEEKNAFLQQIAGVLPENATGDVSITQLKSSITKLLAELSENNTLQEKYTEKINELEDALRRAHSARDSLESKLTLTTKSLEERATDLEQKNKLLTTTIGSLESQLSQKDESVTDLECLVASIEQKLSEAEKAKEAEKAAFEKRVRELDCENTDRAGKVVELKKQLEDASDNVMSLEDLRSTLESELKFALYEQENLSQDLATVRAEKEELAASLQMSRDNEAALKQRLQATTRQLAETGSSSQAEAAKLATELSSVQQQLKSTLNQQKAMQEALDSYSTKEKAQLRTAALLEEQIEALREKHQSATAQVSELQSALEMAHTEMQEMKGESEKMAIDLDFAQNRAKQLQRELGESMQEKGEIISALQDQLTDVMEEAASLSRALKTANAQLDEKTARADEITVALAAKEQEELHSKGAIASMQQEIAKLKEVNGRMKDELTSLSDRSDGADENSKLLDQIAFLKRKQTTFSEMLEAGEAAREEKNQEIEALRCKVAALAEEASDADAVREAMHALTGEKQALESEVATLKAKMGRVDSIHAENLNTYKEKLCAEQSKHAKTLELLHARSAEAEKLHSTVGALMVQLELCQDQVKAMQRHNKRLGDDVVDAKAERDVYKEHLSRKRKELKKALDARDQLMREQMFAAPAVADETAVSLELEQSKAKIRELELENAALKDRVAANVAQRVVSTKTKTNFSTPLTSLNC